MRYKSMNTINYNDSIDTINEKLLTEQYNTLSDEAIHNILLQTAIYDSALFKVQNGQVVRK